MFCQNCGHENPDGMKFCSACGASIAPAAAPTPTPVAAPTVAPAPAPAPQTVYVQSQIPEEYKPISMWGYFGYELLFALPFAGFIVLIVMCFAPSNINVKNFARSYFCFAIVVLILLVIFFILGAIGVFGISGLAFLDQYM